MAYNLRGGRSVERNGAPAAAQMAMGRREIQTMLPEFDPENPVSLTSDEWIARATQVLLVFDVGDEQALMMIGMQIKGPAAIWFWAMRTEFNTLEEFRRLFILHFPTDDSTETIKKGLEKRKSSRESVENYVYTKMKLARRGGYTNNHLMTFIINGIPGESNRIVLRHAQHPDIPSLLVGIKRILPKRAGDDEKGHSSSKQAKESRGQDYCRSDDRDRRARQESPRRGRDVRRREKDRSPDHRSASEKDSPRRKYDRKDSRKPYSDPEPGRGKNRRDLKCFACNELGHYASKCPRVNPGNEINIRESQK
ncbi:hypothetical protein DMENIID0001_004440 [Sergentomyia squamirostris]